MKKSIAIKTAIVGVLLSFGISICLYAANHSEKEAKAEKSDKGTVIHINEAEFLKKVVDVNKEGWTYLGDKPCVLDFYASWCGPCRMISPYLDDLAKEYKDKIYIYKIDVDKNKGLAQQFGATSIPLLVFIPMNAQPQAARGAMSKEELRNAIETVVLR